jgi:hypothetical protein
MIGGLVYKSWGMEKYLRRRVYLGGVRGVGSNESTRTWCGLFGMGYALVLMPLATEVK